LQIITWFLFSLRVKHVQQIHKNKEDGKNVKFLSAENLFWEATYIT